MNIKISIKLFLVVLVTSNCVFLNAMERNLHVKKHQSYRKAQGEYLWLYDDVQKQVNAFKSVGMQKNRIFEFFHKFAYLLDQKLVIVFEQIIAASLPISQEIILFTRHLREVIQSYSTTDSESNTFNYKKIVYKAHPGTIGSHFLVYENKDKHDSAISWLLAYYYAFQYLKNYGLVHNCYYPSSDDKNGYAQYMFSAWIYGSIGIGNFALPFLQSEQSLMIDPYYQTLYTIFGDNRLLFTQQHIQAIQASPVNALLNDSETFCYANFETVMDFLTGALKPEVFHKQFDFFSVFNHVRAGGVGAVVLDFNHPETGKKHSVFLGMRKEIEIDASDKKKNRSSMVLFDSENLWESDSMLNYHDQLFDLLEDYLEWYLVIGENLDSQNSVKSSENTSGHSKRKKTKKTRKMKATAQSSEDDKKSSIQGISTTRLSPIQEEDAFDESMARLSLGDSELSAFTRKADGPKKVFKKFNDSAEPFRATRFADIIKYESQLDQRFDSVLLGDKTESIFSEEDDEEIARINSREIK